MLNKARLLALSATLFAISLIAMATLPSQVVAGPNDYNVSVSVTGFPSFYSARVFADGGFKGTITSGGSLTIFFNDPALGTAHVISVDRWVPDGYPYYAGYQFYGGYSGIAYYAPRWSVSFTGPVTNGTAYAFAYYPLFFLNVQSEHGSPRGTGWYPAGVYAPVAVDSPADESGGTRYRFDRWDGGAFGKAQNEAVNSVLMDGPKTVRALWITQYYVTVSSPYGAPIGSGWYDSGAIASFSINSLIGVGPGTRRVFTGWSGDNQGTNPGGTIAVTRPITVVATWKTQHWVTVENSGGQVDQESLWVDEGSTITITASSPAAVIEKRTRLVFVSWSGSSTSTELKVTVLVNAPVTIKANWKTQYYFSISTPLSQARGEGWYDAGTLASFGVIETRVPSGFLGWLGVSNVFQHWTGDVATEQASGSVLMDSPKVITAVWGMDYTSLYVIGGVISISAVGVAWKRDVIVDRVRPVLIRSGTKDVPEGTLEQPRVKKVPPGSSAQSARFCTSCGTENPEKARYCMTCGTQFGL